MKLERSVYENFFKCRRKSHVENYPINKKGENNMVKTYTVDKQEKSSIVEKFENIGARVKIRKPTRNNFRWLVARERSFRIDVAEDKKGQFFDGFIDHSMGKYHTYIANMDENGNQLPK